MYKRDILFLDLETTGLIPGLHEITEIGGVLLNKNLEVESEFELKVLPTRLHLADPKALKVNFFDIQKWLDEGIPLRDALAQVGGSYAGVIVAGWNFTFDWSFITAAFHELGMYDPFYYHRLDVMSMAASKLHALEKYSLSTVADYIGVENEKAHTALSDARTTAAVFKALMTRFD